MTATAATAAAGAAPAGVRTLVRLQGGAAACRIEVPLVVEGIRRFVRWWWRVVDFDVARRIADRDRGVALVCEGKWCGADRRGGTRSSEESSYPGRPQSHDS